MLKYRGEAPPAPIVVPHGKRVIEPSMYIPVTLTPALQKQQAQSQVDKTPKNNTSTIVQQVNTSPTTSAATNVVVFFALLLALAIVAGVLWLEKRSGRHIEDVQMYDEMTRVEGNRDEKLQDKVLHGENFSIPGKIFLPSSPIADPAKSEELTVTGSLRGRSTGLLSRYGETHQD